MLCTAYVADVAGTARPFFSSQQPIEQCYHRDMAIDSYSFASLVLAASLGISEHPGFIRRWRVERRNCAVCPGCYKYRAVDHARHSMWSPDALDVELHVLPSMLTNVQQARPFVSPRDLEVLGMHEYTELIQIDQRRAIRCSCDGGGDVCRFIGVPPFMRLFPDSAARISALFSVDPLADI